MEIRCSQDCKGDLWVGKKRKRDKLSEHIPQIDIDNIKETLNKLRGNRDGAFWLNMSEGYIIVMKEGMKCRSDDNTYRSIKREGIIYE